MASSCMSRFVNDAQTPVRATYVNRYKWPESDAEFIRSIRYNTIKNNGHGHGHDDRPRPEIVDSISCRQLYLRSYTFSKKNHYKDNEITKCFKRVKSKAIRAKHGMKRRAQGGGRGGGGRSIGRWRKVKEVSCAALVNIFRRLLFCTTKVN